DWLISGHAAQGPAIEMIEMRVGDEHGVDRRQIVDVQSRTLQALDHAQPHRPVGIDQNIEPADLNEEGSVSDPGNAHLSRLYSGEERIRAQARALGKE